MLLHFFLILSVKSCKNRLVYGKVIKRTKMVRLKEMSHWRSEQPSEQLVFLTTVQTAVRTTSVTPP